jgi:hypothetical protein
MPYHLTGLIKIPQQTGMQRNEIDHMRRIEALEVDNFELRDEITRLTLHNTTLRRMLKLEESSALLGGESEVPISWMARAR